MASSEGRLSIHHISNIVNCSLDYHGVVSALAGEVQLDHSLRRIQRPAVIMSTIITLHVRSDDAREVASAMKQLNRRRASVGPVRGKWVTVFDGAARYDDDVREKLAADLSRVLDTTALLVSLIKYNRLELETWTAGGLTLRYELDLDSVRGEPSPEKTDERAAGIAARLLPLCAAGTTEEELDASLRALTVSSGRMALPPEESAERADRFAARLSGLKRPRMSRESAADSRVSGCVKRRDCGKLTSPGFE